jgi:hypothetical protein
MTTKTYLVIMACFALSVLTLFSFVVMPANAQAISLVTGFNYQVRAFSYQASTDTFWILSANQTGKVWLYQMDRETGSLIFSFNHTQNWIDNSYAIPNDIWCGQTDCFITTASNTAGQVVRISTEDVAPNIFAGKNVTGVIANTVAAGFYQITGRDAVSGGFGSVTLWVDTCSTSVATNCNGFVWVIDGISMLKTTTLGLYSGGSNLNKLKMAWSGIADIIDNHLAGANGGNTDVQAGSRIIIYNLSTLGVECQTASPSTNSLLGIDTNYQSAGSSNNKVYTGSINGILYVWSDTCVLLQTITTGLSGDLRYVQYDSGFLFVQETGANAYLMSFAVNSTGHVLTTSTNTYQTFPSSSQSAFVGSGQSIIVGDMVLLAGHGTLYYPYTGDASTDKKIGILGYNLPSSGGGGAGGGNQENGRCGVGTALDCVGDRSLINQVTGGTSWGTLGNALFGGIGLVNTTASNDIKDNGTGLLLMLMLGAFFSSITIATIGVANSKFGAGISYTEIPKEYWLFLVIGVVAVAFYLQWIPDIVFYTLVLGMAGLFSFGLYKHIRGG